MSKYKYNLLGFNLPDGYVFVKMGDQYMDGDVWWESERGISPRFIFRRGDYSVFHICSHHFPIDYTAYKGGYIRKVG